jgi:phosphomannomutase
MKINPKIFKAYDVRGIYPEEFNEKTAYWIGRAFISHTKAEKISVGRDMRESSEKLQEAFIKGALEQGADVVKIGFVSTPLAYFSSWNLDVDGSVIVTASHNPAEWNGMKFCLKNAVPIGEGSGMEEIRNLTLSRNIPAAKKTGSVLENNEIKSKYLNYIAGFFQTGKQKRKIVIDFANAMGINDKAVYEKFPSDLETSFLYDNFDGTFPNHEANPLKTETLEALQKKVVEVGADLGIAYDGDADRIGFVDEAGVVVPMDYMIALLSKEILKKHPGATILMDLRSSNAVKEAIEKAGGKINRCRVGHSLIKKQMREEGAIFAGELSGHYFFEENSKAELPTLAAVMLINLLNESGKKLSELTSDFKRYFHSGEINLDVENKTEMMHKLKKIYEKGILDELDGIRIDFSDWWFNVRPSNTEPKLRLNLEAKTEKLMEDKKAELLKIIRG